jgi:hypothetical protein
MAKRNYALYGTPRRMRALAIITIICSIVLIVLGFATLHSGGVSAAVIGIVLLIAIIPMSVLAKKSDKM